MNNDGKSVLDYRNAMDEAMQRAIFDPKTKGSIEEAKTLITKEEFIKDAPKNS